MIPSQSLAVGSPAKVIRTAPQFPRPLTAEDRARLVREMVAEFERYVEYHGARVQRDGAVRSYALGGRAFRLLWRGSDGDGAQAAEGVDTVLSEAPIPPEERRSLHRRGVSWLDLACKERSDEGSPLTEEVAQFLGRYGIRLRRVR
jgi:hypothetical protein